MNNSISVKTDLFKFITLRSPQLIDPIKREFVAVEHPDFSKSHFLKGIKGKKLKEARQIIAERKNTFNGELKPRDLQANYPRLYRFGYWLMKNKKSLKINRLNDEAKQLSPLNLAHQILIWDQLFYQLLSKRKPAIRQTCTSILIADHFIRYSQKEDLVDYAKWFYESNPKIISEEDYLNKFLKRLANSKVLVPKVFSVKKNMFKVNKEKVQGSQKSQDKPRSLPRYNKELLKTSNENSSALYKLRTLSKFKDDIKNNLKISNLRTTPIKDVLSNKKAKFQDSTRAFLSSYQNRKLTLFDLYRKVNNGIMSANRSYRDSKQKLIHLSKYKVDDYCYLIRLGLKPGYDQLSISIKLAMAEVVTSNSLKVTVNKKTLKILSLFLIENDSDIKTYQIRLKKTFVHSPDLKVNIIGELQLSSSKKIAINADLDPEKLIYINCLDDGEDSSTTPGNPELIEVENDSPELYGVNHIGMGVFRRVEQEVCCYVPGEVSHIENIMAREYKERSTRNFTSTEDTIEESSESAIETNTDTSTTVRNEMHQAVTEVLNKNLSLGAGGAIGVEGSTGNGTYSANANFGIAMANAASTSDTEAQIYAEDITRSAAEKVLKKVTAKRTSKIIKEFEEKIRHGYDNRDGDQHVTGIYRWIDIIYTNRLINYGNMEMVEFLIPEPSRFYKETILGRKEDNSVDGSTTTPPLNPNALVSLRKKGIHGPDDILAYSNNSTGNHPRHYQSLASYYGINVENHPPMREVIENIILNGADIDHKNPHSKRGSDYFDPEYEVTKVVISGHFEYNPGNANNDTIFSITVAGKNWEKKIETNNHGTGTKTFVIPDNDKTNLDIDEYISGNVEAVLVSHRAVSYNVNIKLTANITDESLLDWQTEMYELLEAAYQDHQDELVNQEEEGNKEEEENLAKLATGNTALNRRIEIRELKRSAIEMITRPFGENIGADYIRYGECEIPYPKQNKNWEKYSSKVKFFEQAFEWEIMAYLFYPYFWASRCDWKFLLKAEDSIDLIFESFLQSGMARVVVPVRRGFERAVNYYLETGEIWNGGDLVIDTDDDLYLSIDEELEEPESFVEEEWETRVPSSLTLIQGDSAFLQGEGLPCCHDEDAPESKIGKSTALLGVIND